MLSQSVLPDLKSYVFNMYASPHAVYTQFHVLKKCDKSLKKNMKWSGRMADGLRE